ncbi:SURF1 family protein [Rhizobium sullae]|uniref:SURF1-like protein n=1 Tax=Rhizobium sullae TaxID=50338 RepID=A0ABY5XK35_RHISU|nr:SURF1 family protein [Rhizobium sullae]UWU14954.1 SURF1 family protein [Rhizobium sullae]
MTDIEIVAARRSLPVFTGIAVLIALAILISLGTWQVERLYWKESLIADIAERRASAPVPLADIERMLASGADIEYRPVTATGRYVNDKERHFFATWRGRTGYYVYTPLEVAGGRYLFVNRGFVPFENKEPEKRMQGQLTGEQTVAGLARNKLPGKPSWVVPENDVAKNIFYWKDLDVMATSTGLDKANVVPFFVDADSTPNPKGLPIGGVTEVDLPNNHLQYAFTWYGLAAVLVVIVVISWFRGRGRTSQ